MKGIISQDVQTIKSQMNKSFFLVMGSRNDRDLLNLIPLAENVMVSTQICVYCKAEASFENITGQSAVCRGCRTEEAERAAKIDGKLMKKKR